MIIILTHPGLLGQFFIRVTCFYGLIQVSGLKYDMAVQIGMFGCEWEIADWKGHCNFRFSVILRKVLSKF